ncbi:SDR family oxidoreductase [Pontibacillus salicampi]|uniref:SDR family oxidoreductase n=1 Tax=Pontibacillus salicampi TaxID=1449801 RepID=A0ABV6LK60_9BACI
MENAIITGASEGVGREIALRLAEEGYRVFLLDKKVEAGSETEEKINLFGEARFYQVDVTDYEIYSTILENIAEYYGGISILINNAESVPSELYPESEFAKWSKVIDLHIKSVMAGIQTCIRSMIDSGSIINISSLAGVGTNAHDAPEYAASNAAVIRLTSAMSEYLAARDITINTICTNGYTGELPKRGGQEHSLSSSLSPEEMADVIMGYINGEETGKVLVWGEDEVAYELS